MTRPRRSALVGSVTVMCAYVEAVQFRRRFGARWKDIHFAGLPFRTIATATSEVGMLCLVALVNRYGALARRTTVPRRTAPSPIAVEEMKTDAQ